MQIASSLQQANASSFPTQSIAPTARRHRTLECPEAIKQLVKPIQLWLDAVEIDDPEAARLLYKIIPGQCPFERDINLFGRTILSIPPLCKLNPFYDQLVSVRFRAMCYLVDECGESLENLD
ncbi:Mo-dependent nitrogenase C-terminal domain-containing protein [filamentous cyanobacterium LEGE 11480]|uniref:Mo-dependent nitrogenase C-terminal domain-containing protein n=2 Tax=Romeriopsis TaxID=2992131 RepID=A0A928Z5H4_9CYAN|nr:Mo-dependent nitrogenase C-terminal domain-containing protein [Romeriopsis navalis LEGE 11480]